jgi:membrane-bound serine protease (ClpP class)
MTTLTAILLIVALMACGMILLIAEVAIIPGFGLAGISAAALIVGGAAFAWSRFGATWGMGSLLLSGAATFAILKIAPRTRAGKALVLSTELKKGAVDDKAQELVGKEGKTLTALRPAGAAEIEGRRLDVVTDGVFVEAGRAVRVMFVEGARIVVAPL